MKAISGIVILLVGFLTCASYGEEARWTLSVAPPQVTQSGVAEIRARGKDLAAVQGFFGGREILFFPDPEGGYSALAGIDLEEKPGFKEIRVRGQDKAGTKWEGQVTFYVKAKPFPQEKISVPASFDQIDEATRKEIEREQQQMARLWATLSPSRLWEGRFLAPVSGTITSPFGLRRIVNGLPRAPHGGVDLRAALGTEVLASNSGRVVLRDEFFFNGKSLVLDHGGGLYTMYFHLQDFAVEVGSEVRKGDPIGLSGMTGRVTGPHLHWGARLNGARIDPFALLEIGGESPSADVGRP